MTEESKPPTIPQRSPEEIKAQKKRNMWLGLALFGFVLLVLMVTVIRLATATGISERM